MIGVDTNVLVRFLVEDDPEQAQRVRTRLQEILESGGSFFVADIVLCELVWVLQRSYRVSRQEIAERLRQLVRSREVVVSSLDQVLTALDGFAGGAGDLADFLILEACRSNGCETVVTFDQALHRQAGFEAV